MSEARSEVLIVGAGPIGLFSALLLAQRGIGSTIVERYPSHLRTPKAHVINARTLEIFRAHAIDVGHLRSLATRPEDSQVVRFAESLVGREYGCVPFEHQGEGELGITPTPLMNLPQPVLEDYLEGLVEAEPLITVRREHVWAEVEQRHGRCYSTVRTSDSTYIEESRYVLGCDGAASTVRTALEIPMEGAGDVQSCLTIQFRANLRKTVKDRPAIIYWIINSFTAGALVAHDIDSDWVFIRFDGPGTQIGAMPSDEDATTLIKAAIGGDADIEILRMAPWMMTAQVAALYRSGNVFLVGDAAHRFPPNGGLGMNTGLQDAHNLIWKIAAVEEGWAMPTVLDSYEQERRDIARANSEQSLSNAMTGPRLVSALLEAAAYHGREMPDEIRAEVDAAIEANAITFDNLGLQLGFSYHPGRTLPPAPDIYVPRADCGDRLPHAWIGDRAENRSVLDLLAKDRFTLFKSDPETELDALVAARLSIPLKIVRATRESGFPEDWLALTGLDSPGGLLVRPDGHILAKAAGGPDGYLNALMAQARAYCHLSRS